MLAPPLTVGDGRLFVAGIVQQRMMAMLGADPGDEALQRQLKARQQAPGGGHLDAKPLRQQDQRAQFSHVFQRHARQAPQTLSILKDSGDPDGGKIIVATLRVRFGIGIDQQRGIARKQRIALFRRRELRKWSIQRRLTMREGTG